MADFHLFLCSTVARSVCEPETSRIVVWGKKFILLFLESFLLYTESINSREVCARGLVEGELGGDLLSSWKKIKLCINSHLQIQHTHTHTPTYWFLVFYAIFPQRLTSPFGLKFPFTTTCWVCSSVSALNLNCVDPCAVFLKRGRQRDSDTRYSCNALRLTCCCSLQTIPIVPCRSASSKCSVCCGKTHQLWLRIRSCHFIFIHCDCRKQGAGGNDTVQFIRAATNDYWLICCLFSALIDSFFSL